MNRLAFYAMGSKMSFASEDASAEMRARLVEALDWFRDWEQRLSRFRADSELSQLNRQSGRPVRVSRTLWSVIKAALNGYQMSGGLVTPAILGALEFAGYDRSFGALDFTGIGLDQVYQPTPGLASCAGIELDAARQTVRLPQGMRLDLGGIAKGWAADRAARRLGKYAPTLVDAGGDIAVSGPFSDGKPWLVGVGDARDAQRHVAVLRVSRGGVATSGSVYRRWQKAGLWQHHIIDPRSGRPAETDLLSVTVSAPSACSAEAAAKTIFILGSREGLRWLEQHPRLAGILALQDGRIITHLNS